VSIHPISFLLGLGAAIALPAIAKIARPVVVELAAAGMALYDDAVRVASEQMEAIEDIVAEARAKREAALAGAAAEASAGVAAE
jgi:hypothetical protein